MKALGSHVVTWVSVLTVIFLLFTLFSIFSAVIFTGVVLTYLFVICGVLYFDFVDDKDEKKQ